VNFDIRTLSIITAVSSLVFAFAAIVLARLVPSERYLRDWAAGSALAALSTLLVGLRGLIPDLASAALANTLLTVAFVHMYIGARGMVRLDPPGRSIWLLAVFAFIGLSWFVVADPSVLARVLIVTIVNVPLMAMTGQTFWQHDRRTGPSPLRIANRLTSMVYFAGAVLLVARTVPALQSPNATAYLSSSSALFVAPYFWAILFNVWLAIMITLTVSARLQTDLGVARDQAEANSSAKSQFLANMSHEIRTPMNAILGMLKLLQGTELTHRQQDYTTKTEDAARSLLGLLNDILDFSKVEAGKMSLDPQPFSVERLLRELSVVLSANVGAKPIEVLFDIDPQIPTMLVGDAMRLQQVLINLGGNAVKFTAQGQVVLTMRLRRQTGSIVSVECVVRDTGIGIAPENQSHIFSGFSQAEASTTRRFGGTGLGLAISQRLVSMMGGTLQLESVLGHGSTFAFSLELPVASPDTHSAGPAVPDAVEPRTVLIIDGNPFARDIAATVTRGWHWPTTTADSGEQALQIIRSHTSDGTFPFQLVFVSWRLPGMDGWEAVRCIREASQSCVGPPPVIVMLATSNRTALAQRSLLEQSMLDGFLVKPVTASMLKEAAIQPVASGTGIRKSPRASKPRRLDGMRLLVVEDNLINQQVAQELLRSEGAQVVLASNGQLGVEALASNATAFDAVLMDVQMPVLDGYGATRVIRQELGLKSLPIIAMTANAMESDREACLAAGMDDHIGKPFDLTQLVLLLRQYVWPQQSPGSSERDSMGSD
jgi:signal transduction histidine kinase/DNA-binding response OmpR family regulator